MKHCPPVPRIELRQLAAAPFAWASSSCSASLVGAAWALSIGPGSPRSGDRWALKSMLRSGDPKAEARFSREIKALGRVDHPHLVKIFTSASEADHWFYSMELVEGATLAAVCEKLSAFDQLHRNKPMVGFRGRSENLGTTRMIDSPQGLDLAREPRLRLRIQPERSIDFSASLSPSEGCQARWSETPMPPRGRELAEQLELAQANGATGQLPQFDPRHPEADVS